MGAVIDEENKGPQDPPATPSTPGDTDNPDGTEKPEGSEQAEESQPDAIEGEETEDVPGEADLDEGGEPEAEEDVALYTANQAITVKIGDDDTATVPTKADGAANYTRTVSGVTVTFTGGVADDAANTTEGDLTFTVASDGSSRIDGVTYTVSGSTQPIEAEGGVYTIAAADLSGAVEIGVNISAKHTVTFEVAAGASVTPADGSPITSDSETKTVDVYKGDTFTFTTAVTNEADYSGVKVAKKDETSTLSPKEGTEDTYEVTIEGDVTYTVTPIDKWSKVTMAVAADSDENATVTFGDSVDPTSMKAEADKDIVIMVAVADPEKTIDKVEVNDGSTGVTANKDATKNEWTIAANTFADLTETKTYTVKVTLKAKEYTATLPFDDTDITWEYQEKGAAENTWTATTSGQELKITADKTYVLRASVKDSAEKKYSVTVAALDETAKTVAKDAPATWEFGKADFKEDGTLDLSGAEAVELVDITVAGSTTENPFTVKYFALDDDKKTESDALAADAVYTEAAGNKIENVAVNTAVYLQIVTGNEEKVVDIASNTTTKSGAIGTVYLVTASTTAANNTVTVTLKDKEYTATLPFDDTDITWEYQEKGAVAGAEWTATTSGQELKITADKTIVLRASVKENADKKYSVTVEKLDETAKTVAKDAPAEWEFSKADFEADGTLDLSGAVAVELVDITVAGSTTAAPFTVKYFALDDGKKTEANALAEDAVYTAAENNKIENVAVETEVYLQIDAGDKEVTAATNTTTKYGEIGTVYLVTASTTAESNTVAVTLDTAAAKKVHVTKDDHVATVKYAPGEAAADRTMPASGEIRLPNSVTKVSIGVTAEKNYEIAYVHTEKGKEHKETNCGAWCVTGTGGAYTIDLAAAPATTEIDIATKKTMVEYRLAAAAGTDLADINVKVRKADADGADPVSVSNNDLTVAYKLGSGDTYYIGATKKNADNDLIKDVVIASDITDFKPVKGTNEYRFTADSEHSGDKLTFTFTANKKENKNVSFVMDANMHATTPIKTGEYTKLKDDKSATENVPAVADFAALASPYSVYEGTAFSFQLKPAENYVIKAVTYQTATGEEMPLNKGDDDFYKLESVTENTTVKVTTEVDPAQAYGIKIKDNSYVKSAKIDWTGAKTPDEPLTVGEDVRSLAVGAEDKVNFSVEAKDGYTVDEVLQDGTKIEPVAGQSYYQVTLAKNQTSEIEVKTKAAENTTDKYVKLLASGRGASKPEIAVTAPSGLEPVKTDIDGGLIYKLTGATGEGADKKPGTDEITVEAKVADGYELTTVDDLETAGAVKTAEKDGTYTFTISASATQLTGATTEGSAKAFTFASTKSMVTLKKVDGNGTLKSVKKYTSVGDDGRALTLTTSGVKVDPDSMIVVTVEPGDELLVNGKPVELADNSWSDTVKLGGGLADEPNTYTFKAVKKAEYKVQYKINNAGPEKLVDGDIDVKYGDRVTLSIEDLPETAKILSAVVTGEGAASKAQPARSSEEKAKDDIAVVDVKDAGTDFGVVLTVEDDGEDYSVTTLEAVSFKTTKAVTDIKVKGIKSTGDNKLDATSRMTYALELKNGNEKLNAADYAEDMLTVESADASVAAADINDGNVVVEMKTTGSTTITIKSKDDKTSFVFTVAGQDPARKMKVKTLASSAQGMNDLYLDITPGTSIKEVSGAFNYYYEVQVETKKTNEKTKPADHNTGYYYYPVTLTGNKLQAASNKIKVNEIDPETRGDQCGNTYTFTANLVALTREVTPGTKQTAPVSLTEGKEFRSDALKKDFSTRNKYYEEKLGVTKKTTKITSGQTNVLVALPKFSAKASYIDDVNVDVYNLDGTKYKVKEPGYGHDYSDSNAMTASWNRATNEITLSVGAYTPKGNYNLVIEAYAHEEAESIYDMYRATATVKFSVVNGISSESTNVPKQVVQTGARDASITLKTTGSAYEINANGRRSTVKPAVQKFEYKINTESIKNPENRDQVIAKGNKITVKKGFKISKNPENNKFIIWVSSKDAAGLIVNSPYTVEVTGEALVPTEIYLQKNGRPLGNTLTTLEAKDAEVVVKASGRVIDNDILTITPAYTGRKTGYDSDCECLRVVGKGALTLKAVTTDGGKKNVQRKDRYNISYPSNVTYSVDTELKDEHYGIFGKDGTYQYAGKGNDVLCCQINAEVPAGGAGEAYDDYAYTSYFNYSVSASGGKIIYKNAASGYYEIVPNARKTVITVTDKANRNQKLNFSYTNLNYVDRKAPSASTKSKLYLAYKANNYNPENNAMTGQELKYTLRDNKDGYNAVKFTAADDKSSSIIDLDGTYDIEGTTFSVGSPDYSGEIERYLVYPRAVGNAKYNVVYGNYDKVKGIFYPKTKTATLTVKVSKLGNMKPNAKYTINAVEGLGTKLTYKPVDGKMYFDGVVSANVKGEKNKFYDFFKLSDDGEKLEIRSLEAYTKIAASIADPRNEEKLKVFNPKEDLTGYLQYHYYTVNGRVDKADKITVVVKADNKVKYAADAVNVLAIGGVEATTSVTLSKAPVMLASAKETDAAKAKGWTVTAVKGSNGAATSMVKLTCSGTPEKGKVEFYVIPNDSPKKTSTNYAEDGILVSANVTVLNDDAATAKAVVNKKLNLTHDASVNTTDKVVLTAEAEQGSAFTLAAGGYAITKAEPGTYKGDDDPVKAAVKSVAMKADAEVPTIMIKLDGKAAAEAAKRDIVTVPVKLTFDKGTAKEQEIALNVKLRKKPELNKVTDGVIAALEGHELTEEQLRNGTTAASAMKAWADANADEIIDPMSGLVIEKIEAVAADKWGEGENKSYGMIVTLKDVYAEQGAAPTTVDIVAKKKAEEVSVSEAASAAAGKIVGTKDEDAEVAKTQLVVDETTTETDVANWILNAVKANATYDDKDLLIIQITNFKVNPPTESTAGSLKFVYEIYNTMMPYSSETSGDVNVALPKKQAAPPTPTPPAA